MSITDINYEYKYAKKHVFYGHLYINWQLEFS